MGCGQDAGVVHLAMHDVPEQAKPAAQSALVVQLVLQAVPPAGQMKLFAQLLGLGNLQVPAEHVPASTMLGDEQVALPQATVGNEQVPVEAQIPLQAAIVFPATMHWLLSQQLAFGMHLPSLQTLKPAAVGQLQTPAPAQVKFPPHDAAAGGMQAPLEHVPAPTRLAPEQVGLLHPLVVL